LELWAKWVNPTQVKFVSQGQSSRSQEESEKVKLEKLVPQT